MDVKYETQNIVFRVDDQTYMAELEKVYLKQFDGATVKFVTSPEGDSLTISIVE